MKPKIRFKGFEGEWKTPSIGEVFELRNGYTPSKAVNAFWEGGTIPWFRMEDIRTNGGILKDAIQHITPLAVKGAGLFEKNSIILATTATIGVHAMLIADSLANQQFTNFKVRKSLSDKYINEFLYYSFFNIDEWSKKNTNTGGLLSVNMPLLVKQPLYSPCKQEQQAIATYFTSLDSQISAATSRLASLKQMKAASLQAMFPQEGETVPKIRFKGFEGEWKKVKFGTLLKECTDKSTSEDEDILLSSAINGVFLNSELFGHQRGRSNIGYRKIKRNMLILSAQNLHLGNANVNLRFEHGLVSPAYKIYDLYNVLPEFMYHWIKREETKKFFLDATTAGASLCRKNIVWTDLYKQNILLPKSDTEQQAIATYFTSLDRQISLQSQRLEKLKQIKSACLDKMFV